MDVEVLEEEFFGLCKCCLQDGCFRDLWIEHDNNGVLQNYGQMLNECFTLQWPKPDNMHSEHICDECSKRTVDAYSFRQLVLSSQEQLMPHAQPANLTQVLDAESGEIAVIVKVESWDSSESQHFEEYEEVEYLEEDEKHEELKMEVLDDGELVEDPDYCPEVVVTSETKRRPKKGGERKRTNTNYAKEALMKRCEVEDEKHGEPELGGLDDGELVDDPDYCPEVAVTSETKQRPKKRGEGKRTNRHYTFEDLMKLFEVEDEKHGEPELGGLDDGELVDDPDYCPEVAVTSETKQRPKKGGEGQRTNTNYTKEDLTKSTEAEDEKRGEPDLGGLDDGELVDDPDYCPEKHGEPKMEVLNGVELVEDPEDCPKVAVTSKKKQRSKKGKRTYRNYTEEALMKSIEAAKSGRMSVLAAATAYNVPRKTVAERILREKRGIPTHVKIQKKDGFTKEVKTLLTHTNMIPYKTHQADFYCAYCGTDGPDFEDPDELRTHTRTQHAGERTKAVESFLRPKWRNEILKVDIENLHCTVCCTSTSLVTWNDMFRHLAEQHNLFFDEAYTRVIPYILKTDLRCALCKQNFPDYYNLDLHMNDHYNNYVCSECGDTFITDYWLKKHLYMHETGRFVCEECGKIFTLDKYRKKHVELVHKQEQEIHCLYCPEKFLLTYPRHLHVLNCHPEKVETITCDLCGKSFDWRPYFDAHIRSFHKNEKKHKCNYCSKMFRVLSKLKRHEVTHVRKKRKNLVLPDNKYECSLCGRHFSNKDRLITHFNKH